MLSLFKSVVSTMLYFYSFKFDFHKWRKAVIMACTPGHAKSINEHFICSIMLLCCLLFSVELESDNVCLYVCLCYKSWGSLESSKNVGFGWNLFLVLGVLFIFWKFSFLGPGYKFLYQNEAKPLGQPGEPKNWTDYAEIWYTCPLGVVHSFLY